MQEFIARGKMLPMPTYRVEKTGPDHAPRFWGACKVGDDEFFARYDAATAAEAEQLAAGMALYQLRGALQPRSASASGELRGARGDGSEGLPRSGGFMNSNMPMRSARSAEEAREQTRGLKHGGGILYGRAKPVATPVACPSTVQFRLSGESLVNKSAIVLVDGDSVPLAACDSGRAAFARDSVRVCFFMRQREPVDLNGLTSVDEFYPVGSVGADALRMAMVATASRMACFKRVRCIVVVSARAHEMCEVLAQFYRVPFYAAHTVDEAEACVA